MLFIKVQSFLPQAEPVPEISDSFKFPLLAYEVKSTVKNNNPKSTIIRMYMEFHDLYTHVLPGVVDTNFGI